MVAGFVAGLLLSACNEKKAAAPPTPPPAQVTVEPVKLADAAYFDEYPATVTALNQWH